MSDLAETPVFYLQTRQTCRRRGPRYTLVLVSGDKHLSLRVRAMGNRVVLEFDSPSFRECRQGDSDSGVVVSCRGHDAQSVSKTGIASWQHAAACTACLGRLGMVPV